MKIKNVLFLILAVTTTANAQLTFGFVKVGPKVVVFGNRSRPTYLFVDNVPAGVILPGGEPWSHDFAAKIREGGRFVMISAEVCESSRPMTITLWPPTWAADPAVVGPDLILDQAYLNSRPDRSAFEKRIKGIKGILKKRIGYKMMEVQLAAWLDKAKEAVDFKTPGATCEHPSALKGYRVWVGASPYDGYGSYGYYGALRWTIPLYVEGTPDTGYKFRVENPTRIAR